MLHRGREDGTMEGPMSDKQDTNKPYRALGGLLKALRVRSKESLIEVSGAVEIDSEALDKIESGEQRPTEDVLSLLITHFDAKEEDAKRLWKLAGYQPAKSGSDDNSVITSTVMVMPMDIRVVYTDMVHVMVNNYGVMMNFMQTAGPNSQPMAVARVGMSKEHAQSVLEILQQTLNQSSKAQRSLPAPKSKKDGPKQN